MKKYLVTIALLISGSLCFSNNITVSNVYLYGQDIASKFVLVNADLAWNNSWHTNVGPSNWDAAWVFIKYRLKTQTNWNHATLHYVDGTGTGDGHIAFTAVSSSNDTGTGGAKGVFVYNSSVFAQASVSYTVGLRWDYGVDGLADADKVEICVIGIEMVYVPTGSFYVGDGNNALVRGQFRIQASNIPFLVTSEAALTLGGAAPTSLLNNNAAGMTTPDDFNNSTSQTLPATFPKGITPFYSMKYEITQEQYVEFLNKLDRPQQANRFSSTTVGTFFGSGASPTSRNGMKLMSDPGALALRIFGCDLNNNGTAGEANDGQTLACNWLSAPDLLAYLDWAALRPMTELEYEKTCRGPNVPLAAEYSWESTAISGATGLSNQGASNEIASNAGANAAYGNAAGVPGPMRVGSFAQAATTQVQAGAGYYGMMDLTGNVWEDVVLVGSAAGRSFTGLHGNGTLNAAGAADVNFWPGINGNNTPSNPNTVYGGVTGCTGYAGISFTGGTWQEVLWLTVSDRDYRGTGWNGLPNRDRRNGGRGARFAP